METRLLFVHVLSPLHAGTGQGTGVIDLPIAREKATGLPFLPGSSLKGILRDACTDKTLRVRVFGPETENASDYMGSAHFADARLLLLPVRSLAGTFAWVTSPYVLQRLARDVQDLGLTASFPAVPVPKGDSQCLVGSTCALSTGGHVYLEDLDLTAVTDSNADAWADEIAKHVFPEDSIWHGMLAARLCIVHDDVISFLLSTATEVTARVKLIEDKKTVQQGGLWYEEALPAETILSGLVAAIPIKATEVEVFDLLTALCAKAIQVGGKATVGRGLCRVRIG